MTSQAFQREEGPCGQETAIERQLLPEKRRDLDPTRFW
jgi:hypothetical protein